MPRALDDIAHNEEGHVAAIIDEDSCQLLTQCVKAEVGDGFILTFGRQDPDYITSSVTFS